MTAPAYRFDDRPDLDLQAALSAVLHEVRALLERFVYFPSPGQVDALTLWTAYTHWFGRGQPFSFVPYALVTSAERQSGKSTALEIVGMLAHEPLVGQDMSAALVGRTCGGRTLLLDEIDGVYSAHASDDPSSTDLRTILNAGFKYDGKYHRLDKGTLKPQEWSVYGPKMLVGIGRSVPETVADRSIAIRMERKQHGLNLPKFREAHQRPAADGLRLRLADLASTIALSEIDIAEFPAELDGRRQDIWEPLYALAQVAGPDWYAAAVDASRALTATESSVSLGVQLLGDIRDLFEHEGDPEMIPTRNVIGHPADEFAGTPATGLCAFEESPWATFTRGKPITPYRVSLLLGEYDIKPERAYRDDQRYGPRGYWRAHFEHAWSLYPDESVSRVKPVKPDGETNKPARQPRQTEVDHLTQEEREKEGKNGLGEGLSLSASGLTGLTQVPIWPVVRPPEDGVS